MGMLKRESGGAWRACTEQAPGRQDATPPGGERCDGGRIDALSEVRTNGQTEEQSSEGVHGTEADGGDGCATYEFHARCPVLSCPVQRKYEY
jgi:hypothetical protein